MSLFGSLPERELELFAADGVFARVAEQPGEALVEVEDGPVGIAQNQDCVGA